MRTNNRWVIAIAGVFFQIALGAVYAWSVFRVPLAKQFGWSISEITLTFTISIFVLGFAAFFGGLWLNRKGPRIVALSGGAFYGLGVFLASFTHSLSWLYLSYGLIGGIGLGLGYIVPVAVLVKWFPDKRGLVVGLMVGLSSRTNDEAAVRQAAILLVDGFREHSPAAWPTLEAGLQEVRESLEEGRLSRVMMDDDGTVLGRTAHHRRPDEEARLEGLGRGAVTVEIAAVIGVQEDVGAALQFGVDPAHCLELDGVGPGDGRALDAAALMLEVGISALVRTAGDKLRRRCISWRLLPRIRPDK